MQRFDPNKLRELRQRAGVSREQLAWSIHRSVWTVRDYEKTAQWRPNHSTPSLASLQRIARVLDCDIAEFFTDFPEPAEAALSKGEQRSRSTSAPGRDDARERKARGKARNA